jgi:hypothetical protein
VIFEDTVRDRFRSPVTAAWEPRIAEVVGRFADASNATLLATTDTGERVIYKPTAGEQPLWDFPYESLAIREVLTYEVAAAMGLDIVPQTVIAGGPYGPGAVQRFIDEDPGFDPVALARRGDDGLWPVAVLDVVTNNADRKLGHLLGSSSGLRAIDHGLTFHPEDKLRTVLWAFAGKRIPEPLILALARLQEAVEGALGRRIRAELGRTELRALRWRIEELLGDPVHPEPPADRPPIPWPPY